MRISLTGFILASSVTICAIAFGVSIVQARADLSAFAQQERIRRSTDGLRQLERSADIWLARQVRRAADLGSHPVLIQGVMQPETKLRELRRYLNHVRWDGRPVQFSVLDFRGSEIYRRLDVPQTSFVDNAEMESMLSGSSLTSTHVGFIENQLWISVLAPIGREGIPEGVIVATLPLSSLQESLQVGDSDGLELRFEDRTLTKIGQEDAVDSIQFAHTALKIHFGSNTSQLDVAIDELETALARDIVLTSIVALTLLGFAMRRLLGRPLNQLVDAIEDLELHDFGNRRVHGYLFRELDRLSSAFNAMLSRLGESRAQLVEANRSLESRVQKRTAELEARNQELEQFAYVASHDLQEPLRKIISFSEILTQDYADDLDDDGKHFVGILSDAALRMRNLIQDLLEYSRVGRENVQLEVVDSNVVVQHVLNDIAPRADEKQAEIAVAPLPSVMATPRYLGQLLQNLLTNAIKFSGSEPPRIEINAEVEEEKCVIRVRDHGIGIDPKYHEKIFGMFERLHSRDEYPGTGIGLAICKKISEQLNGDLWLEETPGGGTTFYLSLKHGAQAESQPKEKEEDS